MSGPGARIDGVDVHATTDVLDSPAAAPAAIRGGALRMLAYGASILLAFASAPLLIRHLGVADFGRYALVNAVLALVAGVTEGGLGTVAQREWVQQGHGERREMLAHLLGLRIALTVVSVGVATAFFALAGYGSTLVAGAALAGLGVVAGGAQHILATPLVSGLRFGWVTAVDLARQALTVALVLAGVLAGAGVLAFLAVPVPVSVVALALTALLVRRSAPLRPLFHARRWWELVRDSVPYAAAVAVSAVYFRITLVILSLQAGRLETGLYATSTRIVEVILAVPALLVSAVFPVLARAASEDGARLDHQVRRIFEVGILIGLWLVVCVELGAQVMIDVVAGAEAHDAAAILRVQGPAVLATFVAVGCAFPLLGLRRTRAVLVANLAALAGSVTLTLALAPSLGGRGAALATVVAEALLALSMAIAIVRARPGLRLPLGAVVPLLGAAGLAAGVALATPVPDAARVAIATVLYGALLWAQGRIPEELVSALRTRRSALA